VIKRSWALDIWSHHCRWNRAAAPAHDHRTTGAQAEPKDERGRGCGAAARLAACRPAVCCCPCPDWCRSRGRPRRSPHRYGRCGVCPGRTRSARSSPRWLSLSPWLWRAWSGDARRESAAPGKPGSCGGRLPMLLRGRSGSRSMRSRGIGSPTARRPSWAASARSTSRTPRTSPSFTLWWPTDGRSARRSLRSGNYRFCSPVSPPHLGLPGLSTRPMARRYCGSGSGMPPGTGGSEHGLGCCCGAQIRTSFRRSAAAMMPATGRAGRGSASARCHGG